jgi:hypothetical protein
MVRIMILWNTKPRGGPWFAWHPVEVDGVVVWLETVRREWDEQRGFSVIHPDDRGDYVGGWRYARATMSTSPPGAGTEGERGD